MHSSRREFLQLTGAAVIFAGCGAGFGPDEVSDAGPVLDATPQCEEGPSEPNVEGPFYKPDAPERADLTTDDGVTGTVLSLFGQVLSVGCVPLADATLDFWQANKDGVYDDVGFVLRGVTRTDADGNWTLRTIIPGNYAGRPRHLHVKVSAPGYVLVTTQLYFPDDPLNLQDPFILPSLVMTSIRPDGDGFRALYHFALAPA
jgi:protocatechuate 3,4-dioxygenase beta subunit